MKPFAPPAGAAQQDMQALVLHEGRGGSLGQRRDHGALDDPVHTIAAATQASAASTANPVTMRFMLAPMPCRER